MPESKNNFSFDTIGIVHSPFKEKFGIPRQSGLAQVDAVIELLPPYALADSVRGLDEFSHIWIVFFFHAIGEREWNPLVRPPRLGGNDKLGVFATRSTHRPNAIGMSAVALTKIDIDDGVRLHVRAADLLDGTPVLDIKPYIPYADSIAAARASYAQNPPPLLPVRWHDAALMVARDQGESFRAMVETVLAHDPRPAYQDTPERIYGVHIENCNVRFRIDACSVEIIGIEKIS